MIEAAAYILRFGQSGNSIAVSCWAGWCPPTSRDIASAKDPFTRVQTYGITEILTATLDWATLKSYTSLRHSDATFGTNPTAPVCRLPMERPSKMLTKSAKNCSCRATTDVCMLGGALFFYEYVHDSIAFPFNLLLFGGPNQIQQGYLVSGQQSDKSAAPYVRLTYDITDEASLILGARYSFEKKIIDQNSQFDLTRPILRAIRSFRSPGFPNVESKNYHQTTPTATFDYKLTPDVFLFATYAEGFKSGGFNPEFFNRPISRRRSKNMSLASNRKN